MLARAASALDHDRPCPTVMPDVNRPNFFIVGAPKCGTTSMDEYLAQHPQIHMAAAKEMHYFAPDIAPENEIPDDATYFGMFADAADTPVRGESSVFYMLSHVAAERIAAFDPTARILVMLRDPVEVIASHHSQIVFEGYEPVKDLATAVGMETERRANAQSGPIQGRQRVQFYREVVGFSEQIERFLAVFPRDQVYICLFDDLRRDTAATYRNILTFLGVDPEFRPDFAVHNANKVIRFPALRTLLRESPDWVTQASRIAIPSQSARDAIKARLRRLNTRFVSRPDWDPALKRQLREELRPEVQRLSELLERDLRAWCGD